MALPAKGAACKPCDKFVCVCVCGGGDVPRNIFIKITLVEVARSLHKSIPLDSAEEKREDCNLIHVLNPVSSLY